MKGVVGNSRWNCGIPLSSRSTCWLGLRTRVDEASLELEDTLLFIPGIYRNYFFRYCVGFFILLSSEEYVRRLLIFRTTNCTGCDSLGGFHIDW